MRRLTGLLALIILGCMFLSCPGDEEKKTEQFEYWSAQETGFAIPEDLMGMCHAGYHYVGKTTREVEYNLLDEMGVRWIQRDFSWGNIQPASKANAEPEDWNWSNYDWYVDEAAEYGKKILGMLLYGVTWIHTDCSHDTSSNRIVAGADEVAAFSKYAAETVKKYKDKVGAWCIWNEPNLDDRFWYGTPEEFFILTKAAAAAIREAVPDAVIIGGAMNTLADDDIWTKGLIEYGSMDQIDSFAYHPYLTDAVTSSNRFVNFRDYVADYSEGLAGNIWVTEVGYPMLGNYGTEVAEEDMPEMVTKTITLLAVEKAARIFWYELLDNGAAADPGDSENWFGLINSDNYEKKGGADGYQLCALNIPGKTYKTRLPMRSTGLSGFIKAYYFEGNGKHTLIIWNEVIKRSQRVQVTLPGTNQKVWSVRDGSSSAIGETSTYTLGEEEESSLCFFTWDNNDSTKPPRLSAP